MKLTPGGELQTTITHLCGDGALDKPVSWLEKIISCEKRRERGAVCVAKQYILRKIK